MIKSIITFLLLFYVTFTQAQMFWQRPVVNYNRHEYNAGNQNWMVAQHQNGWMYFANNKGLLEFDGVYWNLYPISHQAKMRSIKISKNHKIYVGGLKEFGYFTPNAQGGLDYHSLSKGLDPYTVSNIWNVHLIDKRVYFQGDRFIFCYDQKRLSTIDCNGVSFSGVVNQRIYFNNYKGLSYLHGNRIIHVPHSEFLGKNNVVAFLPYQGKLMIITNEQGIFLYDGKVFSKPFPVIDNYLKNHRISCAAINGKTLAIGTTDSGLFIADLSISHIENISIENGLQNKSLLSLTFDHDHNLWLGLDNGIDYVSLNTNLFFLNSKLTSIGAGYCSHFYNGKLYLGTNQGVYVSTSPTSVNTPISLARLQEMGGLVHCIYQFDGKLFCGGRKFFAMIDGQQVHQYNKRGVWHVQAISRDGDLLLIGTYWGLEVMRKVNGSWLLTNKIAGCKLSAKNMFVEPESGNVWIANKSDGLWRVTLDTKFTKVLRKKCYNNKQLPIGDNVYINKIDNSIIIASRQGLFRYNSEKDIVEPAHHLEKQLDGHCAYTYIKQDNFGRLWYVTNGVLKRTNNREGNKSTYLSGNMIEDFEDVYVLNNSRTIVGTEDGFALINTSQRKRVTPKLNLQIRKLYVTNGKDSLIYGRSIEKSDVPIVISYHDNSVRIAYSCDNYNHAQQVAYSYRLKGFDKHWSEYTNNTFKEYTDLPEGKYTFELKILSDDGKTPIISTLSFRVLPPWYRSWWAYILYILLFAYAIYYSWRKYKTGRERLIRMKDAEMNRQKTVLERDIDQKKKQIDELEEEKLRNELNYKSDELVKTTLNVVRKNEILQKIKKDAESLSRAISEDNLVNVRRGMLRLITQINTNIEHDSDLDNFQSSFDAVHNDFFKKLDAQFPQLTHKDKMLCAYIKMNLMSKEIAPLLNISVRGVEISRYRLRKKLNLDEKANLADFLQKI